MGCGWVVMMTVMLRCLSYRAIFISLFCVYYIIIPLYISPYIYSYIRRNRSKPVLVTEPLEIEVLMGSHGLNLAEHTMLGGHTISSIEGAHLSTLTRGAPLDGKSFKANSTKRHTYVLQYYLLPLAKFQNEIFPCYSITCPWSPSVMVVSIPLRFRILTYHAQVVVTNCGFSPIVGSRRLTILVTQISCSRHPLRTYRRIFV